MAALLSLACADAGRTASELAQAAGEGAAEGFYQKVVGEYAETWASSRGVSPSAGLGSRGVAAPDCTGVKDEFVELYDVAVVRDPQRVISVLDGRITRAQYIALPRETFRFDEGKADGAIGLVLTSAGNAAKLIFSWAAPGSDQGATLTLRDVVVFDAESGAPLRRVAGPLAIVTGIALDLDPPEAAPADDDFDLVHGVDANGEPFLAAAGSAAASFPKVSRCVH